MTVDNMQDFIFDPNEAYAYYLNFVKVRALLVTACGYIVTVFLLFMQCQSCHYRRKLENKGGEGDKGHTASLVETTKQIKLVIKILT